MFNLIKGFNLLKEKFVFFNVLFEIFIIIFIFFVLVIVFKLVKCWW